MVYKVLRVCVYVCMYICICNVRNTKSSLCSIALYGWKMNSPERRIQDAREQLSDCVFQDENAPITFSVGATRPEPRWVAYDASQSPNRLQREGTDTDTAYAFRDWLNVTQHIV